MMAATGAECHVRIIKQIGNLPMTLEFYCNESSYFCFRFEFGLRLAMAAFAAQMSTAEAPRNPPPCAMRNPLWNPAPLNGHDQSVLQ